MAEIPFFKKLGLPKFSLKFLSGKPTRVVGVDIGAYSTKVVQLKYEAERAILETYGELLNAVYLKTAEGAASGFLKYLDGEIANLITDLLRESNTASKEIVFSVPAATSFVTTISMPRLNPREMESAIPYEARKYIPIPISEVVMDWLLLETGEERETQEVLLVAVPREIVEKFKRISELAKIDLKALEVETFSLVRSLVGHDQTPTAIINFGHQTTNLIIADKGIARFSHSISRGSQELTNALEKGLGVDAERAENLKREIGISERAEDREIVSVISPMLETLFAEIERLLSLYNRKSPRHVQKINLTGGGSNLKNLVDYTAARLGLEVTRGNPFARVVTPVFMQPTLREIGPNFSTAVGLALRELTI